MTSDRMILVVGLCVMLLALLTPVYAQSPIANPSFEAVASVVDELVVLSGTSHASLAHSQVIPSSVVVKDVSGTITYTHGGGADYVLHSGKAISRTASSAIPNGATVKVSYSHCAWSGWVPYSYSVTGGEPADPLLGAPGAEGTFDVLYPSPVLVPQGLAVCGAQAWANSFNGGVRQTFFWGGGAATISVTARAYSLNLKFQPDDNGCRVRMGLVPHESSSRDDVATWVTFPWGPSWSTRTVEIPSWGTYTLYIEAYQPNPLLQHIMSTLWDNVVWTELPAIHVTNGPTATVPGDPDLPDSSVRIEWSTDVPSTSKVEYGLTDGYGQVAEESTLTTYHSMLITGLAHSSAYHFRASSAAPNYTEWFSDDASFQLPITFSDIAVAPSPDGDSTIITWQTDVPTTTRVEYGLTTSYGQSTPLNAKLETYHQATLSGLDEDSVYHFRLWGTNDPLYAPASSGDQVLRTLPDPKPTLRNGSFEESHGASQHSLFPWVQYAVAVDSTGLHPIQGLVGPFAKAGPSSWFAGIRAYDGSYFVGAAASYEYKNGGVFQRVFATPGQAYTLSARYATHQIGGNDRDTRLRIGIDPNGGVDPNGAGVIWRSVFSPTNDAQWHVDAVTAVAGPAGVVTLFLDFRQQWPIEWHVAAVDDARFGPPLAMSIGTLKSCSSGVGAVLSAKTVTYVGLDTVVVDDKGYVKAYIEEDDASSGIAVLFDQNRSDQPLVGNKVTVTGSIVMHNMEAMLLAHDWTLDSAYYSPPKAMAVSQRALGGSSPIQPAIRSANGACNVGLRVRVFGRVTWVDNPDPFSDSTVFIDDGSGLPNGKTPGGGNPAPGVMVKLRANGFIGANLGDYIVATGPLGIRFVDPNNWPGTGDEYYTYCVWVAEPSDWSVLDPVQ